MKNKDNIYKNTLTGDLNTDGALLYSGEHSIKNIDSLLRIVDGETVLDSDVNTINNCTKQIVLWINIHMTIFRK